MIKTSLIGAVISMIATLGPTGDTVPRQEILCLAQNVYYETRGEPVMGQAAVAWVTINRSRQKKKSVCATVWQPNQFRWTLKNLAPPKPNSLEWRNSVEVAVFVYIGWIEDPTGGCQYFVNADDLKTGQKWLRSMRYIGYIGRHHFFCGE